jgi:hypothetical protein
MVHAEFSAAGFEAPFDRDIVKAIREEVHPEFVPLAIRRTYRSSNGDVQVLEHHAVAWKIRDPKKQHQQQPVTWPNSPGHVNYGREGSSLFIEDILSGTDLPDGRPGPFYPINSGTLMVLKAKKKALEMEPDNPGELARQIIQGQEEAKNKALEAARAEASYRLDHETAGASASFDDNGRMLLTKARVGHTGDKNA